MCLITPKGWSVTLRYSERHASLTVVSEGTTAQYDEDECDKLLRVVECASDPAEDLTEFFRGEFPRTAYRVAVTFTEHARLIAEQVYCS